MQNLERLKQILICPKCKTSIKNKEIKCIKCSKRYLSKNSKLHLEENFIKIIEDYRANLSDDPKKQIHRDDFFELMSLFLRKSCKFELKLSSIEFVSKSLFLCIEINRLLEENLFKKLKNWIEMCQTSENI